MKHKALKTYRQRAWQFAVALTILSSVVSQGFAEVTHKALATTWKGYADTNLQFSEFYNGEHTISIRFMSQYPYAYEGPMFAESGTGDFLIGQGDFRSSSKKSTIMASIGYADVDYEVDIKPGEWHHLAMVRRNVGSSREFHIYLDGTKLGRISISGSDHWAPVGAVRLGKRTTGQTINQHNAQYYGLLDDVAVFTYAMSDSAVQNLAANVTQLTGYEPGLLAGYTFNDGEQAPRLQRPVTFGGGSTLAPVSANRSNTADKDAFRLYSPQVEMSLPFPPGEAWTVIQGYNNNLGDTPTHNGYAAFCWDFIVTGFPQSGVYPSGTKNAPFYAAAHGKVIKVKQDSVSGKGNISNQVEIEQAPGEIASYLHLKTWSSAVNENNSVLRGDKLALAGDTGARVGAFHLHFGAKDMTEQTPGFVTFPIVFSNYDRRDSNGNWRRVLRGIPQDGDVIRVPFDPTPRYNAVWRPAANNQELHMEGATFDDFKAAYDDVWPLGWRIDTLQAYVSNGVVFYNAVWRPGAMPETQVYRLNYSDFLGKYADLHSKGWRIFLMQSYVQNGVVRYDAVWRKTATEERILFGGAYQNYRSTYDALWQQGWRLQVLQSYVVNGQVLYNAVWRPVGGNETQVYGWTYQDYRNKYDQLWQQGWRLSILQSYVLNGQALYNAVWTPNTSNETQIYGATYDFFRQKYDELHAQGWRLETLDAYQP